MSEGARTFQLRYVGPRFVGPRLPVSVLSDLPAFRDLLVSYAKEHWRRTHAERRRLPKGFDKSISLDLTRLLDGSAVTNLNWSRDLAQEVLPGFTDELEELVEQSYHDVVGLIDAAAYREFPAALSSEHIRALNKFGSGLRDDEKIEFVGSRGRSGNVVYLDSFRRKEIITHVREYYEQRFDGLGRLTGLHEDGTIIVDTAEHGELRIEVHPDRVVDEFDGNIGETVQFEIMMELDNQDKLRRVVETFDVDVIDPEIADNIMRCNTRLDELRGLDAGWHGDDGETPTAAALDAAGKFLRRKPSLAGAYRIYPTLAGGVLIEFEWRGWDYSVEFSADGSLEMYGIEIGGVAEMQPTNFPELGDDFVRLFDQRITG